METSTIYHRLTPRRLGVGYAAAVLLLCLVFSGCAPHSITKPQAAAIPPEVGSDPIRQNHTPFPNLLVVSEDDYGNQYHTAIIKVTFQQYTPGVWRFAQVQEEISDSASTSTECPRAIEQIQDIVPFRRQAEVYTRPVKSASNSVHISVSGPQGDSKHRLATQDFCRVYNSPQDFTFIAYPQDGTRFSVSGLLNGSPVNFEIPKGFAPFLLVRYHGGQVVFTPARADTITLDTRQEKLIVVYRSTFPLSPAVRKLEYRAVLPDEMRSNHGPQQAAYDQRVYQFLRRCSVPSYPVEECSLPTAPQDPALFVTE